MFYIFLFSIFSFFLIFFTFFSIKKSKKYFKESFKSLSYDLMEKNNKSFLELAQIYFEKNQNEAKNEIEKKCLDIKSLIDPIKESLKKIDENTKEIEKDRISSFSSLKKQIEGMVQTENLLREETQNLKNALKSPNVKGSWGQIHLRRVVELTGMLNRCDFFEQESKISYGRVYRPDLLIKLPGGKNIVIDAKTPIDAYLEAMEEKDLDRKKDKLKKHAKNLKKHIKDLSSKEYWKHFSPSVEYVILFLPKESFFSHAVAQDPHLLESSAKENVIIATPTILIAILKAISYFWKSEDISKNTEQIAKYGKELYERIGYLTKNWKVVGDSLNSSMEAYRKAMFNLKSQVGVTAKKLKDLGAYKGDNILEEFSEEKFSEID